MFKRIAIVTLICLATSLWPPRAAPMDPDGNGGRHIGGLAGHAAVLVANTRVRVQARAPHQPTTRLSVGMVLVHGVFPLIRTATRSIYTLPSHRVATHLSL
jgi:hypothetical protein